MLLHLAESKYSWLHSGVRLPPWSPSSTASDATTSIGGSSSGGSTGGSTGGSGSGGSGAGGSSGGGDAGAPWRSCVGASGLGYLNASCGGACSARAPIFEAFGDEQAVLHALKLTRHRVQNQWAGHIKYPAASDAARIRLRFGACEALPLY